MRNQVYRLSRFVLAVSLASGSAVAQVTAEAPQFTSTIQLVVHEPTPALLLRSQKLVVRHLGSAFGRLPEHEIRTVGNEVVLSLVTSQDNRVVVQENLAEAIERLHGVVRSRGRLLYYRTSLDRPMGGLEVEVDEPAQILMIKAQSVPLRDLLKEIKAKVGNLSYLIPGECAAHLVDWRFGARSMMRSEAVDTAMSQLAALFNLRSEKKKGTYIFSGNCHNRPAQSPSEAYAPEEILNTGFMPISHTAHNPQVHVPFLPLGE